MHKIYHDVKFDKLDKDFDFLGSSASIIGKNLRFAAYYSYLG